MEERCERTSPVADRALFRSALLERDSVALLPSSHVVAHTATDVLKRTVQGDDEVWRRELAAIKRICGDLDVVLAAIARPS